MCGKKGKTLAWSFKTSRIFDAAAGTRVKLSPLRFHTVDCTVPKVCACVRERERSLPAADRNAMKY